MRERKVNILKKKKKRLGTKAKAGRDGYVRVRLQTVGEGANDIAQNAAARPA